MSMRARARHWLRWLRALGPLLFFAGLATYAVWPWLPFARADRSPRTIVFYGFSITGEVMNSAIFPAFAAKWEAETGERVTFVDGFAGSGTVTNQLIMGVPADVALLALESDAERLSNAGVVAAQSWRALPHGGVVNRSPFVIVVRPGNPLGIATFGDLAEPGVRIVHPDPLTSGAANWSVLAEYGAGVRAAGGDAQGGVALLRGIWGNVVAQASSARGALTQFQNGFGDALITYEQDVLLDVTQGRLAAEIVYPPSTIFSEHTVVVLERHVDEEEEALVAAFVDYLWSDEAQRLFTEYGFRSVDEGLNERFSTIADPLFVADFGGWEAARPEIIDAIWKEQVLTELGR